MEQLASGMIPVTAAEEKEQGAARAGDPGFRLGVVSAPVLLAR